jgi:hypothetical protein
VLADLNPLSPKDRRQVIVVHKNSFFFEYDERMWGEVGWGGVWWGGGCNSLREMWG